MISGQITTLPYIYVRDVLFEKRNPKGYPTCSQPLAMKSQFPRRPFIWR
jgi:hypothetical protein